MHPPICQTQYEVGEILEMIGISTDNKKNKYRIVITFEEQFRYLTIRKMLYCQIPFHVLDIN